MNRPIIHSGAVCQYVEHFLDDGNRSDALCRIPNDPRVLFVLATDIIYQALSPTLVAEVMHILCARGRDSDRNICEKEGKKEADARDANEKGAILPVIF